MGGHRGPRVGVQQSAGPVSVHCEGVEGADFPSVSLVMGVGHQLRGLWFAHSHGGVGVEGAALPLTQLYCHKNTASITTTLSRALIERGELSHTPLALAKTSDDGSEGTKIRPSARGHLRC